MNIFDALGKLYHEIDNNYASLEIIARSKGHVRKESEYSKKRELNDQAYFLFMFTRLEGRIRELSDNLIDQKMLHLTDWQNKRTWEIINKQKATDTLHLMNRVGLLTPRGQADFNLINQYYGQRNSLGHGSTFTIPINIPVVITDMKRLHSVLKS